MVFGGVGIFAVRLGEYFEDAKAGGDEAIRFVVEDAGSGAAAAMQLVLDAFVLIEGVVVVVLILGEFSGAGANLRIGWRM